MNGQGDMDLLRAWTRDHDREALGHLINKHINFVYATARRQVGDAHLAEDVTQAVFILLLQKARHIKGEAAMTSWLFTTTRYAAANAMKLLRRRKHYEHAAAQLSNCESDEAEHEELAPLLDDAIAHLPAIERTCVMMSFLQQKTHREVGELTGLSEEAARKRVSRAIERMRAFFASRGVVAESLAIGTMMTHQPTASAGLAESTLNVALLSQSAAQTGLATTIAKGVSNMLFTIQIKLAAAVAIAVLFTGLVTGQVLRNILSSSAITLAAAPMTTQAADPSAVALGNDTTIKFLGIAPFPDHNDWQSIDGKPIDRPTKSRLFYKSDSGKTYQVAMRIHGPDDVNVRLRLLNVAGWMASTGDPPGDREIMAAFATKGDSLDMAVDVADGPWQTMARSFEDKRRPSSLSLSTPKGGAVIGPLKPVDAGTSVWLAFEVNDDDPWRIVCIDLEGHEHLALVPNHFAKAGHIAAGDFVFDVPAQQIGAVAIQNRAFNKHVIAKGISLDPAKPAKPHIIVDSDVKK